MNRPPCGAGFLIYGQDMMTNDERRQVIEELRQLIEEVESTITRFDDTGMSDQMAEDYDQLLTMLREAISQRRQHAKMITDSSTS